MLKWHIVKVPQKRFLKMLWESLGWGWGWEGHQRFRHFPGVVSLSLFIAICGIIDGGDGVRAMKHPTKKRQLFFSFKGLCLYCNKKTKYLPQVLSP